jgi:hypothetical protein
MEGTKRAILSVLLASLWVSISEFVRNEFLLKSFWIDHYQSLGIVFPSEPLNGAIWGIWSLCFTIGLYILTKKFNYLQSSLLSWFVGFVFMWLVIGNMGVLPFGILPYAIPLSLLEAFLATFIIIRTKGTKK